MARLMLVVMLLAIIMPYLNYSFIEAVNLKGYIMNIEILIATALIELTLYILSSKYS